MATAGSKEARELEKVKRSFDRAYKEVYKATNQGKETNLTAEAENDIKYALRSYSENEKQKISRSPNNVIIETTEDIDILTEAALNGKEREKFANFGVVPKDVIDRIRKEVTDISDEHRKELLSEEEYSLRTRQSEVYHLKKKGMTDEEVKEYVRKIPQIVSEFDSVRYTQEKKEGQIIKGLLFKKMFSDGNMRSYLMVSNKKGTLTAKTSYMDKGDYIQKKKPSLLPDTLNASSQTPVAKSSSASNKNITKEGAKSNIENSNNDIAPIRLDIRLSERVHCGATINIIHQ